MPLSLKKIVLYYLGILLVSPALCQIPTFSKVAVEHFSVEQGLSDSKVNFISKDNQGFLWIATDNGLNRFDGYSFHLYDCQPRSKHKIRFNKVHSILPDRAGNLLLGYDYPQNGTIDILNPLSGIVSKLDFEQSKGFRGKYHSFYQSPDGSLYFLVLEKDLAIVYQFDEKSLQFLKVVEAIHPGINYNCYASFLKASDGTFWFAYNWDYKEPFLIHADAQGKTLQLLNQDDFSIPPGPIKGFVALTESVSGEIWFTLYDHGVYVLSPRGDAPVKRHPNLPKAGYFFSRDKQGNILAYQTHPNEPGKGAYLLGSDGFMVDYSWIYDHQSIIEQVYSDDFRIGLLAGSGNGFNSYRICPERFNSILGRELGIAPYGTSIRGITKSGKDKLFIATEYDGLYTLELGTNKIFRTGDYLPQLAQLNKIKYPRNLVSQGDSVVWIPCFEGLLKYIHTRNKLEVFNADIKEVSAISLAKDGKIWLALRDNRLVQLNPVSGEMTPYLNKNGSVPLENSQPSYLLCSRNGIIWAGTAVTGLIQIDPEKGESRRFTANLGDPSGFNSNHITFIHEDEKGLLWVGTMESGLHVFDPTLGKVVAVYSRENGLRNNSTVGIIPDDKGNYWVSTFSGLSYFDTKSKTFQNYTTEDGLSHNEFNRFAFYRDKDQGRLYFGGMNGVNAFDHSDPQSAANNAPLLISEVSYTGPGDRVIFQSEGVVNGSTISLSPGSRFLHLRLALGNFYNSGGNQFSYKIDGLDKDWNYLGTNRDLRIDQLPAGKYTLHLRGADDRGNWSNQEIALQLVVHGFWYKSWWAFLLYGGFVAAGSVYFYRFQLKRRIAEKEALRLQELDTFKSQFFTNITHEFRTPLTVILGTTDQLIKEKKAAELPDIAHKLDLIKRNGEGLLFLINQILDLSKIESNTLKMNYVQGNVVSLVRYLTESLQSVAQYSNIQLNLISDEPEIIMDYDPDRLQQIIHNLLSNALKFTPAGGSVSLRTRIIPSVNGQKGSTFHLSVQDTGVGIKPEDIPLIFDRFYQAGHLEKTNTGGTGIGLALTKELVQQMGGILSVESEPGVGTTFWASWPITQRAPVAAVHTTAYAQNTPSAETRTSANGLLTLDPERPTLLLIEDNPDVVAYLTSSLQGKYQLDIAYNGKEGIEKALASIPDLIVCDVMMPEKDGFEVCEFLKNDLHTSHIPILILTAKAAMESRLTGLKRGADAYLAKPFQEQELLLTLNNLLRVRKVLQARYGKQLGKVPLDTDPIPDTQMPVFEMEDAFVQKIRVYLEENLNKSDLSVEDLSRLMTMSYQSLHRKLTSLTNLSPVQFIRLVRLSHARTLLQTTNRSITDIAYAVGYNDAKYFSRVYTEEFGKPPSSERSNLA